MVGFKAFVFQGKKTGMKALDTLEDYTPVYPWVDDVAVVSRNKHGHLKVQSTWAQDDSGKTGFGWGAVTGGLIGMLAGPGGALAGAAIAGSLGGLMGKGIDASVKDPRLDEFAEALDKDTSAVVLVGEDETLTDFATAVEPIGGKVIDTELDDNDVKAIRNALKG